MLIYLFNIVLLIIWKFVFLNKKQAEGKGKKFFCILACVQWFILSAFRHYDIGSDTWYYGRLFEDTASKSWSSLIARAQRILSGREEGRDVGYAFIEKLVSTISLDYRFFLIVIAIAWVSCFGLFVYRNADDPFFAFLLFSCLFYSFFAITGIRQTIATSFVIFLGHELIKKRKFIPFLLITVLMSLVHRSCLVCLLLYVLGNKKITKGYLVCVGIGFVVSFIFRYQIFNILSVISRYDNYEVVEGAGTWTFTLLFLLIYVVLLIFFDELQLDKGQSRLFVNAFSLAFLFIPLTFVEPNTMRIVQYFSVYLMLLIPQIFKVFDKESRPIIETICSLVLIGLFIMTNPVYYFG